MDKKFIFKEDQKIFYPKIEEMTDRELQELQCYFLSDIKKKTDNIDSNVRFFFVVTLISIAIAIVVSTKL
jgi:hypothetical protein